MSRPCHVLRVFTRGTEGGNHLGVVNDSVGVADESMQRTAASLGFSETVFVDWTDASQDPFVRIFTPTSELPFAGHPLVGAAWLFESRGPGSTGRITTKAGSVDYSVDGQTASIRVALPIEAVEDATPAVAVHAGLVEPIASRTLALPKRYHVAEYRDADTVFALKPDMEALSQHPFGLYAFSRNADQVTARFFVPSAGIDEDPATGSAAVALAQEFRLRGELSGGVAIQQGDAIDQPCTIEMGWDAGSTTLGGTVVHDAVVQVD